MPQSKQTRVLQCLISLAALAALVLHLVRPSLKIDGVAVVLIAVALLPWLGPLLQSIEMPGGWKFEFRELRQHVVEGLQENREQVVSLAQQVEKLAVAFSGAVTPDLERQLADELQQFHEHLRNRGIPIPDSPPSVRVTENLVGTKLTIAYFDPSQNLIEIDVKYANDPDVLLRQYSHHVLMDGLGPYPESVDTSRNGFMAVESGLAVYLPCSFRNDPVFGRITAAQSGMADGWWDLTNGRPFTPPPARGFHEDYSFEGPVWAALFWELREMVSPDRSDALVVAAWRTATATIEQAFRQPFALTLVRVVADSVGRDEAQRLTELIERRGLALPNSN
jgi:hypothetical protein